MNWAPIIQPPGYTNRCPGIGPRPSGLLSQPTMAAPSYVFAIARVAKLLDEPEELFQDIATLPWDMEPEDGFLSVLALDDVSIVAFTPQGAENLKELLADRKS
jgi:hypothetical protein